MRDSVDLNIPPTRREPAFNAPAPVLILVAALVGAHLARLAAGVDGGAWALGSRDLAAGRYGHLITHLFVHGGWAHLLTNAVFTLTFGAPVARYLGASVRGWIAFFEFFLVCGAIAALGNVGWAALETLAGQPPAPWGLIGASGAASGLFGAASRLMNPLGRLDGVLNRRVLGLSAVWIIANVALGVSGLTPFAAGATVAWQAHVVGLLAGLILIGPFARLADRPRDHAIAP